MLHLINNFNIKLITAVVTCAIGSAAMADDTEVFFKVNPKNMDIGKTNIMFIMDEAKSMHAPGQFTFDGGCVVEYVTNSRKEPVDKRGVDDDGAVLDDSNFIIYDNGYVVKRGPKGSEKERLRYINKLGKEVGKVFDANGNLVQPLPIGAYVGEKVSLSEVGLANTQDCYVFGYPYSRPAEMPDNFHNSELEGNQCYDPQKWYYFPENDLPAVYKNPACTKGPVEGYVNKVIRAIDPKLNKCEGLAAKVNGPSGGAYGNFIGLFERFNLISHEYGWYALDKIGVGLEHGNQVYVRPGGLSDISKLKAIECLPDTQTSPSSGKGKQDGFYPANNTVIKQREKNERAKINAGIFDLNPVDITKIAWTNDENEKAGVKEEWKDSRGAIYSGNYLNYLRYNAKKEQRRRGEMFRLAFKRYIERAESNVRLGLASFKQAKQWAGAGDGNGKCHRNFNGYDCGDWIGALDNREWLGNSDGGNIDVPIRDIDEVHKKFKWFVDHDYKLGSINGYVPLYANDTYMGTMLGTCPGGFVGHPAPPLSTQLLSPCGWWARDIKHREFLWAKASEYFSEIDDLGSIGTRGRQYGLAPKQIMPGINNPEVLDPRSITRKYTTDVVYTPRMEMQGRGGLSVFTNPRYAEVGVHEDGFDSMAVDYRPLGELLYEVGRYFKGDSPKFGAYSRPETWTKHEDWAKSKYPHGLSPYISNTDAMFKDGWGWDRTAGTKEGYKLRENVKKYDSPIIDKCQANVAVIFTDYVGENPKVIGEGIDLSGTDDPFKEETGQAGRPWKNRYRVPDLTDEDGKPVFIFPPHQDGDEQGIIDAMLSQGKCEQYTKSRTDKTCSCDLSMRRWGTCLPAVAEYMANNDMMPEKYDADGNLLSGVEGKNTVNTFIVSYWDDRAFHGRKPGGVKMLEDAAEKGGGKVVRFGSNMQELDRAIGSIMNLVGLNTIGAGTFVAPATSVDLGSRLQNSDQVYYSMFEPSGKNRWYGNLKSYKLDMKSASGLKVVNISDGKLAVNANNKFTTKAHSKWSSATDGADIRAGAAAEKLPGQRKVFVDLLGAPIANLTTPLATWRGDAANPTKELLSIAGYSDLAELRKKLFANVDIAYQAFNLDYLNQNSDPKQEEGRKIEEINKRLAYAQGYDGNNEQVRDDTTPSLERPFRRIGDPLHSQPKLVNYRLPFEKNKDGTFVVNPKAGEDQPKFKQRTAQKGDTVLFFGTNEGYIHAIDAKEGTELFSFLPLRNLATLNKYMEKQLASLNNKPYGMDGEIEVWVNDLSGNGDIFDKNGKVESVEYEYQHSCTTDAKGVKTCQTSKNTEKEGVYLFAGMRRGGNSYYALDVTDVNKPKLMWRITGDEKVAINSSSGAVTPANANKDAFYELGQTWAKPVVANIKVNGAGHPVVILAGGYDPSQDTVDNSIAADDTGRAIYILDAKTGKRIWATGFALNQGTNINLFDNIQPTMTNSIAATPRAFDADGDGFVDTIIAADTGGNIWRIDLDAEKITDTKVEKIAALAGNKPKDARRFFTTPDVLVDRAGGVEPALVIALGSGRRPEPLNAEVNERFYVIRSAPAIGPKKVWDATLKKYLVKDRGTINEADMYDATKVGANAFDANADAAAKAKRALNRKNFVANGFYLRLGLVPDNVYDGKGEKKENIVKRKDAGEKIITDAVIFNGYVTYTSYLPADIPEDCGEALGDNRFNAVNYNNPDARYVKEINQHGIAPRPAILLLADSKGERKPAIVVGTEVVRDKKMPKALQDLYGSRSRDKVIKFWADE